MGNELNKFQEMNVANITNCMTAAEKSVWNEFFWEKSWSTHWEIYTGFAMQYAHWAAFVLRLFRHGQLRSIIRSKHL